MIVRPGVLAAGLALGASVLRAGEVSVLPPGGYADAAEREIDASTSSIRLFLYLFSYHSSRPDSGPARLARALVRAKGRGVDVRAVLDRSADALDSVAGDAKNRGAALFLASGGVDVFLTSGPVLLHAKTLVLDGRTALVGSSNWSAAAFDHNAEADVLIRSTEAAGALLRSFDRLPLETFQGISTDTVAVPLSFVDSPAGLGAMARSPDPAALDVYLHFLRNGARAGVEFPAGARELAAVLGRPPPATREDFRYLRRVLTRMRDNYKLLSFAQTPEKDFTVRLSTPSGEGSVSLPGAYFDFGWDRRLSLRAKVFHLLSLRYSASSPNPPQWTWSEKTLARRHGVSLWVLQRGLLELRRANLLETRYDRVPVKGGEPRNTTIYTPGLFYDPAAMEERFHGFSEKYGAAALDRARALAALVYDDSDVAGIETILGLLPRLPPGVEEEAARVIGARLPDNPTRCMGYLLTFLRSKADIARR